jgi:TonB-linked SusC/RagA family outer membrane protein
MHLPEVEPDILKYINFQKQAGDDARRPYIDDMTIDYIKQRLEDPSLPPIKAVEVNGEWRWLMADDENKFNKVWPKKLQGPSQKHDLSISGSEGKLSYYGAFGFLDQPGYLGIGDQNYKRYNVRFKMDYKVKDWLKLTYNGYFSNENALYPSLAKGDDDEPISGEIGLHGINTYETWKSPDGYFMYAPLAAWAEGGNEKRQIAQSNHTVGFEMNFFKNSLKLFGNYTYQPTYQKSENRRVIPLVQTEPNSDPVYYTSFENPNSFTVLNMTGITKPLNIWGQYEKTFGMDHYVKLMAGFNQESNYYYANTAMRMGMLSNDSRSLNLALGDSRVEDERSESATRGTFYRVNYHFKNKYLLEANGRYSLSSKFPSEDRGGFFPSFSAGWRVAEEPFFDKIKNVINEFKIRGSWGQIGNQDVSNYLYSPTMGVNLTDTYVDGVRLYSVENPDPISQSLTWETVSTLDFGLDVGMLQNRLNFTFDWYKKSITGMLTEGKTLPSVFGADAPEANAADLKNTGWELGLQWQNRFNIKTSPFRYSVGLTLSDNIATITRFDNPSRSLDDYYVGQRIGELWGYEMLGLFKTDKEAQEWVDQSEINGLFIAKDGKLHAGAPKVADLNGDGVVNDGDNTVDNPGDRKIIGNTSPRYIFGLTLTASYKGFDFYALFEGVGKNSFYPPYNSWLFWGTYNHEYVVPWKHLTNDYWTTDNPGAYFPAPIAYGAKSGPMRYPNSRYLQNGAYIRLKNASLGYSIPAEALSRLHIYGLRFFISGENLFDVSKIRKLLKRPLDPEGVLDRHGNYDYPTSFRKVSFGVDLTF